ncbi:hypothetical protein SAMN04488571_10465 [Methanoculleus thermophilus]|jgi:hypothetical protein|uniref:Uncharacterized protein n=1 Tax=Methanoculleus thermophilus TaxID=2200 RepID=A0A1G8ZCG8_9EURY|nr:hypothetical protein SAMN04488571_10465 [Methanoculleus thermophilus]
MVNPQRLRFARYRDLCPEVLMKETERVSLTLDCRSAETYIVPGIGS